MIPVPAISRSCPLLMALSIIITGLLLHVIPAQADDQFVQALASLSTERMVDNVRTLSAPSFNGRQAGTDDDLRSAQWVAQEFLSAGLRLPNVPTGSLNVPLMTGDNGFSAGVMASMVPTTLISSEPALRIGPADHLSTMTLGPDYLPIFDSPTAEIQGPVVFVGYGIVDHLHGVDDYAGIDVNNSIVLFLRGKPEHYRPSVSHADKVRFAQDRGAAAYLTATGPILHPYEARRGVTGRPAAFYGQIPTDRAIPGAWISTAVAESLLADHSQESGRDHLRIFQEHLNKSQSTRSVRTDQFASLQWKTTVKEGLLANVSGLMPGTSPETIIVGAHRDHFGRPAGLLFPGADDNASGTAVMLEVARALTRLGVPPKRTILFVSFSGEENNLLGSRLYIERPIVPLMSTKTMINIDHAGIGNGRLTVGATGLDKNLTIEAGQLAGLSDKLDLFGYFPGGDHVPFKEAGVPTVAVVSGGVHSHFHQPTDTADTIDPAILQTAARYVLALTWQLANQP